MSGISLLVALAVCLLGLVCAHPNHSHQLPIIADSGLTINGIPPSARAYWMRQANIALGAPCPFAAFGSVIVNHTANAGLGELVCTGANSNSKTGNPIMHGEMAAITNCSAILTDPNGPYKLTPSQALAAFADLSLYTNAESCPMCASAIRWAGFKEYIYGTSIDTLIQKGWGQIRISSLDVMAASFDLSKATRLLGGVLANETDPLFLWQFDGGYPCPAGCARGKEGGSCTAVN
ncbi:guanine deaminase [Rhypophila decipiens]|uniref:Guanine deaminase n=1 Tax=Rhypophila decipiens TaxID=261697 RepID=A0AAN6YGP2_9PEZI|nr:guanine deaminase [Rhypophila decipiens]